MKTKSTRFTVLGFLIVALGAALILTAAAAPQPALVKHGEYLVKTTGCGDCHTPMKMGEKGPEPDMTRLLAGHPDMLVMPPVPKLPEGPWMGIFSATMTAWAGPWGVSYSANLTPDKDTGLGKWTGKVFVDTIRAGRVEGKGRALLPPMPVEDFQKMTDRDLKAIWAYLQTIPAVHSKTPDPVIAPPATPH